MRTSGRRLPSGAGTRATPTLLQLGEQGKPRQRVVPHGLEHRGKGRECDAISTVEALPPLGTYHHETRLEEGFELERHGAEGDVGHRGPDGAGTLLGGPDEAQEFAATGGGKSGESGGGGHADSLEETKMIGKGDWQLETDN